jgi:aspartyl-tRNA(Asn)/glutamyl-tRNA(Gln) amidotransferase subunit C
MYNAAMSEEITPELFQRLVELAALELGPEESEYLRGQLNSQLKAIHELARIPIPDNVPPAAHGITYTHNLRPVLRADEVRLDAALAARILSQAPEVEDGYFVVPEIPHTEL